MNTLYYGDNLDILKRYIKDETVDLIYLDPPFKSNQDYNVLFQELDGTRAKAQMKAFEDTWRWDDEALKAYEETVEAGGKASLVMQALRTFLGTSDMLAYLAMMAPLLVELKRVLKSTGSLYLHCDPTASHYLKLVLDAVFGPQNSVNEVIWRRTGAHGPKKSFGPVHDTLLFYKKTDAYFFRVVKKPYMKGHVESRYTKDDSGRYKFTSGGNVLTGAGATGGESGKPWKGFDPSSKGRHWAIPGFLAEQMPEGFESLSVLEKLDALYEAGLVEILPDAAWPTPIRYFCEDDGQPLQDIWAYQPYTEGTVFGTTEGIDADVKWLGPTDPERLGYQTQKPLGLLERVIKSSCPEDGVVLDPFCGCGTTIAAAQRLKREWIGIDITQAAIVVIKKRLTDSFLGKINFQVIGEPVTLPDASALAKQDRYQFQWWALGLVGARPVEEKKGADRGIDGRLYFHDDPKGKTRQIIFSVKSGHVSVKDVRDLVGVLEREKAQIGVLITFEKPTQPMNVEATAAGFYKAPWGQKYRRLQILTIAQILEGKPVSYPLQNVTFRKAAKSKDPKAQNHDLPF